MDYSFGPRHTLSTSDKARRFYSQLTPRARVLLGVVFLFIFYKVFFGRSSASSPELQSKDNLNSPHTGSVGADVSDLVKDEEIIRSPISFLDLKKPFMDPSTLSFYNYENGGNMMLHRDSNYVRLVPERSNSIGYLFSRHPVPINDAEAFQVEVSFKIHGDQRKTALIGDGLALWLTDRPLSQGDVFGMQSDYNGLGVFIDTYKNAASKPDSHKSIFPYVSIQPNNGQPGKYNKNSDGLETEIGGCDLHKIYNVRGDAVSKMKLLFLRKSNTLEINFDIRGDGHWKGCYSSNQYFDGGIPMNPYLGVSAETGQLFHNVDIYDIKVSALKDSSGEPITSVDQIIENIDKELDQEQGEVKKQEEKESEIKNRIHRRRERRLDKRNKRKTLSRLRRQEKELKRKDAEKYGDERGFIGWFFKLVWKIIKTILYLVLFVIVSYIGVIVFRVYRDKQKKKNSRGLL